MSVICALTVTSSPITPSQFQLTPTAAGEIVAGAFGPGYSVSSQHALSFVVATLALAGLGGLLALIAARTTVRHDIT